MIACENCSRPQSLTGTFSKSLVVRELLAREELGVAEPSLDTPGMAVGQATPNFLDACCRLLGLLSSPADIPIMGGLIQREILYRVLRSAEGARLWTIATQGEQSHRTAKAIAWIRANYRQPLRMENLAQVGAWRSRLCITTFALLRRC